MQTKLNITPVEGSFSLKEHIYEVLKDAITRMNIYDEGADLRLELVGLLDQQIQGWDDLRDLQWRQAGPTIADHHGGHFELGDEASDPSDRVGLDGHVAVG